MRYTSEKGTMDVTTIRMANLESLAAKFRLGQDFVAAAGISPSYLSQLRGGSKKLGNRLARSIEERLRTRPEFEWLTFGWLDVQHTAEQVAPKSGVSNDVMAAAYTLESLEPTVRDSIKRLILTIANAQIGMAPVDTPVPTFHVTHHAQDSASVSVSEGGAGADVRQNRG